MTRVVLVMILGNEERVIARSLDHSLPHVDGAVLCVNGRDKTEEIAIRALITHRVRGTVLQHTWSDFGTNRTMAFRAARSWARERNFPLDETYALFLDADMVLRGDDQYRAQLTAAHYFLDQVCGSMVTVNTRLARMDHDWKCIGRTHEYWAPYPHAEAQSFKQIWIDDVNDGGEHGRKYERDAEFLGADLRDRPDDVRSLFYLGETYFHWAQQAESEGSPKYLAASRFSAALGYYGRRIEIGGWDEERWFARYKRALAMMAIGRLDGDQDVVGTGVSLLLDAYNDRPGRAETLAALSRYYREKSGHALAVQFAEIARALPPTNDMLFVEQRAWNQLPDENLAVSCYYLGKHYEGLAACERLMGDRSAHYGARQFGFETVRWYVRPLEGWHSKGNFDAHPMEIDGNPYVPSTPTIAKINDHAVILVRMVNYLQERGRWYAAQTPDNVIRTRNLFFAHDRVGAKLVPGQLPDGWSHSDRIQGLEDCRFAALEDGRLFFTATTYDGNPPTESPRVVLGEFDPSASAVKRVVELAYDKKRAVEKNWVPFSVHGALRIIYGYEPLVILQADPETGACSEVTKVELPWCCENWRGGAAYADWSEDSVLLVVHEVVRTAEQNLYLHRFVELNLLDPSQSKRSSPFCFDHLGIEYAAGITEIDGKILVTYSSEDCEACWVKLDREHVERLLG